MDVWSAWGGWERDRKPRMVKSQKKFLAGNRQKGISVKDSNYNLRAFDTVEILEIEVQDARFDFGTNSPFFFPYWTWKFINQNSHNSSGVLKSKKLKRKRN